MMREGGAPSHHTRPTSEATPIKCDGRESAGRPTDSHIESAGRPTDSLTESVGKPADSLLSHFIGAASGSAPPPPPTAILLLLLCFGFDLARMRTKLPLRRNQKRID